MNRLRNIEWEAVAGIAQLEELLPAHLHLLGEIVHRNL